MKANVEKAYLITSKSKDIVVNIGNNAIKHIKRGKLIGVKIDHKLTFNSHLDKICKKADQKMSSLHCLY